MTGFLPGRYQEGPPAFTVPGMTLFLTDENVSAVTDWGAAIDTLRRAYAAHLEPESVPPRSMARAKGMWLRSLTAISPLDGYLGCKLIAAAPPIRYASYLIALFDQATMELHALIDGNQITGIRTAATAAVAVDTIAPQRPLRVAILGSGFEARAQLTALSSTRAIGAVAAFSPTPANCERFAEFARTTLRLEARAATTAPEAVKGADVVICAARARNESPVLGGEWLEPGMSVVSIGSTLPEQREVAVDVIERAQTIIADVPEEVAQGSGDMLAAAGAGVDFAFKLRSLNAVMRAGQPVRTTADGIVLYKSVGSALQDVVISEMLLSRARARGIGTLLPVTIKPVAK